MHWLIMSEKGIHVTVIAESYYRNRATIILGIKHIKDLIEVDKSVRAKYEQIKSQN